MTQRAQRQNGIDIHAQSLLAAAPVALVVGLLTWPSSELAAIAASLFVLIAGYRVAVRSFACEPRIRGRSWPGYTTLSEDCLRLRDGSRACGRGRPVPPRRSAAS
jgi:hypothetical protein